MSVIMIFLLMFLYAFFNENLFASILSLFSVALMAILLYLKKNNIKLSKKGAEKGLFIFAIILIIPYFLLTGDFNYSNERFSWFNIVLKDFLPRPRSRKGTIYENTETVLRLDVNDISTNNYYDYVDSCKEEGFILDVEQLTFEFTGYNESGCKLNLYYYESIEEMSITLEAPENYNNFDWNTIKLRKFLPELNSKYGVIHTNNENTFEAEIAKMPKETFKKYAKQCLNFGFSNIKEESDTLLIAKNDEGYKLKIEYLGGNIISLLLDEPKCEVTIEVDCNNNLIFSKYDVDVFIDDLYQTEIDHGKKKKIAVDLKKGIHTIRFENADDDGIYEEVEINVEKDEMFKFEIYCHSSSISVYFEDNNDEKETDSSNENLEDDEQADSSNTSEAVFYSTNDYETAKKGNSGVFSYCNKGPQYDIYWIIDFDEGYVYWFTDGNGDETCDKVKIDSGNLNDKVMITYHDGADEWSYGLHFKYVEQPVTLIMQDNDGFEYEYSNTDLRDALAIKNTKRIVEY